MSSVAAFNEAKRRVAAARRSRAAVLDLGDLQLQRLPDELGGLTSLRVLARDLQAGAKGGNTPLGG